MCVKKIHFDSLLFITSRQGRTNKFKSFIMFLNDFKASGSNENRNQKWYFFFELKLWSGVVVIFLVSPLRAYKFYANVADV